MRTRSRARECALKLLYQIDLTGDSTGETIERYWTYSGEESPEIRGFAMALIGGVLQNRGRIDQVLTKYAQNWHLHRMATIDRNILRMATFELLFLPDVPPKVSINEAIDLAKRYGDNDSGKFVNGILDKIAKEEGLPS